MDKKFREWDERREAKARAEGREEVNQAWNEWLVRREQAQFQGKEFDEPPPNHRA